MSGLDARPPKKPRSLREPIVAVIPAALMAHAAAPAIAVLFDELEEREVTVRPSRRRASTRVGELLT